MQRDCYEPDIFVYEINPNEILSPVYEAPLDLHALEGP